MINKLKIMPPLAACQNKKMSILVVCLFMFFLQAATAQHTQTNKSLSPVVLNGNEYTRQDSLKVMALLKDAASQPKGTNLFVHLARKFLGIPYVGHTLDRNKEERLVVNLHELDCTTYVETVLALYLCAKNNRLTFNDFCSYLKDVRYVGGQVAYTARQHYFTLWMEDNEKDHFIKNIHGPNPPFTAVQTVRVNYMTTHVSSYAMLNAHPKWVTKIKEMEQRLTGRRFPYIPVDQLRDSKALRSTVKDGDIISILTKRDGLDTSHIAIAVWKKDGLHFIDASQIQKKVTEERLTLYEYMLKHPKHIGIRIARVL